jgi:ubiquitin carboxyl-terminal hydrolase 34
MLEGDNKYTCSQCGTKVRAEKRACFKSLPDILAFNTMRYSFNKVTMMKEKVNTHFSFPFRLDMTPYMEHTLIPSKSPAGQAPTPSPEYELIGVTVHTGNADGGHYYAFARDRCSTKDKWYSFNDAEVKSFDPNQIAGECFGGEVNSRTYDQVTDKFLDLSIEKTNSAYMLFYERVLRSPGAEAGPSSEAVVPVVGSPGKVANIAREVTLSPDLEDWIWQDNRNFIQDNNIFDHTYFNFMWQMVQFLPTTLSKEAEGAADEITMMSAKLATAFFLETFIHAKEKLNIVQWVEVLTKQLDSSSPACRWLLGHMASDSHWPVTIFLRCNIATIRQMFHRLVIHVIQKVRPGDSSQYLLPWEPVTKDSFPDPATRIKIGGHSPITRFVRSVLQLLEGGTARPHLKHLTELFSFLLDFAKLGDAEAEFLLSIQAISSCVDFYLKTCGGGGASAAVADPELEVSDDDESEEDVIALPMGGASDTAAARTASLDKMVSLIALLVERSRGEDNCIHLSPADTAALTSGKSLLFLYNITRDNINIRQTCNLIFSLTRHNPALAEHVAEMVFLGVKSAEHSLHFFRLLTLLTELSGGPAGLPCYTSLVMHRVWDLAKACPQAALDWLSIQVGFIVPTHVEVFIHHPT